MGNLLLVGCGGFLGAIGRYSLSLWLNRWQFHGFPVATFVANLLGAFLIGLISGIFALCFQEHKRLLLFLTTGVMGGFTTFSTFSLETVNLYQSGRWGMASCYLVISVGACLAGVFLGKLLAGAIGGSLLAERG